MPESSLSDTEACQLATLYLAGMPAGRYHRRDDRPCALFCDGRLVCEFAPADAAMSGLVGTLVLMLNRRS